MISRKPPTSIRPHVRTVYVRFERRPDWQVSYLVGQLRSEWYRTDADSIRYLYDMYGVNRLPEDQQAVKFALGTGAGGMMLNLPIDMYQRIKATV